MNTDWSAGDLMIHNLSVLWPRFELVIIAKKNVARDSCRITVQREDGTQFDAHIGDLQRFGRKSYAA